MSGLCVIPTWILVRSRINLMDGGGEETQVQETEPTKSRTDSDDAADEEVVIDGSRTKAFGTYSTG